jgi:GNAT superfamily N-acetyltransferase
VIVREARAADVAGLARVHVDSWRTTYPGIFPDEFLAGLSYADREKQWTFRLAAAAERGHVVYVAEEEGGSPATGVVVGFATGGPAGAETPEFAGEVYSIYLLQSHQRRGIGQPLFLQVVAWLADGGRTSVFVWVA